MENDCVEMLYNPAPVEYWRRSVKARKYPCKLKNFTRGEPGGEASKVKLHLDVLLTKEETLYVAHGLQLDLVATGETLEEAKRDLLDVVEVQINYAFQHDNLEHLFRPAPGEVWKKFFELKSKREAEVFEQYLMENEDRAFPDVEFQERCYA